MSIPFSKEDEWGKRKRCQGIGGLYVLAVLSKKAERVRPQTRSIGPYGVKIIARAIVAAFWRQLLAWLDEVYPPRCRLCSLPAADGLACREHRLPLDRGRRRCGRCAAELAPSLPDGTTCAACRRRPPPFARVRVSGSYRGSSLGAWILALKHAGRCDLVPALVNHCVAALSERAAQGTLPRVSVTRSVTGLRSAGASTPRRLGLPMDARIVPLPAHPLRKWERGFDQAELLAAEFAQQTGCELLMALVRVRHTPTQGAQGSVSRTANLRAAFRVDRKLLTAVHGSDIVLIDDVVTSCASVAEAARTLKRAGARSIEVIAIARAGSPHGAKV